MEGMVSELAIYSGQASLPVVGLGYIFFSLAKVIL